LRFSAKGLPNKKYLATFCEVGILPALIEILNGRRDTCPTRQDWIVYFLEIAQALSTNLI
jgi:hypothetical protein